MEYWNNGRVQYSITPALLYIQVLPTSNQRFRLTSIHIYAGAGQPARFF
jgi:hypothetical protein